MAYVLSANDGDVSLLAEPYPSFGDPIIPVVLTQHGADTPGDILSEPYPITSDPVASIRLMNTYPTGGLGVTSYPIII